MTSVEAGESIDKGMDIKAVSYFKVDSPSCGANKETDVSLLMRAAS